MESRHWTGDDNTGPEDMTDRERDERLAELEEELTPEEREELRQASLIADAIRRAATFSS